MGALTVAREMTAASDAGRLPFPAVLAALAGAGIERYHADLVGATKAYYTADALVEAVPCDPVAAPFAAEFMAADVEAAVRASQAGAIAYPEFCRRVAAAGCVGYHVTLVGRRVVYYGRGGDSHVELFP